MKYFQLEPIIGFYSAYHFILMTWKHSEWNPRPLNRTWNLYKCPSTVWIFIVKILVCIPNVVSRRNFFFFFFFFSLRFHSTSQNCGTGNSLNTVNSNISPGLCGGEAQRWIYSVGSIRMNAPGSFCGRCHWWRGGSILPSAICLRGEEEQQLASRFEHVFSTLFSLPPKKTNLPNHKNIICYTVFFYIHIQDQLKLALYAHCVVPASENAPNSTKWVHKFTNTPSSIPCWQPATEPLAFKRLWRV